MESVLTSDHHLKLYVFVSYPPIQVFGVIRHDKSNEKLDVEALLLQFQELDRRGLFHVSKVSRKN